MSRQKYNLIKPQLNRDAISAQGGFTLIELLVAAAGGLILMGFMAVVFGFYGRTVRENQAIIRMNDALRSASYKLRQDLQGVTCDVTPWQKPEADAGYFELIEGPLTDTTYYDSSGTIASRLPSDAAANNLLGDYDDVLLFTTRGNGAGFVGKMNTSTIEADAAEVAWFCVQQPDIVDGMNLYSLHRRQLLVVGYVGTSDFFDPANGDGINSYWMPANPQTNPDVFQSFDISLRFEGGRLRGNGLSDLTKRENRFLHRFNGAVTNGQPYHVSPSVNLFPYALDPVRLTGDPNTSAASDAILLDDREGEDVVIRNVLAFDVRVFDPQQAVDHGTGAVLPPDYTDLGSQSRPITAVGVSPIQYTTLSGAPNRTTSTYPATPTYCTWNYHYEFNGLDEDQSLGGWRVGVDQGTNLVDDNSNGAVDDSLELETMPPYNVPLRGIEIRLRCYEPQGKQIRQVTVRHAF
jgi:type II secretory pathway pseudopilin PulG